MSNEIDSVRRKVRAALDAMSPAERERVKAGDVGARMRLAEALQATLSPVETITVAVYGARALILESCGGTEH